MIPVIEGLCVAAARQNRTAANGTIDRLTTQGQVTEFHLPPATPAETEQGFSNQANAGMISSPDGNLWFTEVDDWSGLAVYTNFLE